MYFNADGTIQEVKPTLRGVGIKNALSRIDLDRYSNAVEGATLELLDSINTFLGWGISLLFSDSIRNAGSPHYTYSIQNHARKLHARWT